DPRDVDAHRAAVDDPRMGAEITFVGRMRNNDENASTPVVALEYSAHPDAETTLRTLAVQAIGDSDAIVAVSHRIGRLEVGDAAVIVSVASGHRGVAYEVSRELIEAIKHSLSIWYRHV